MPLEKNVSEVPVGGGIDLQSDEFLSQPPKSHFVENFRVDKVGNYQRLSGERVIATTGIGDGTVIAPAGQGLVAIGSRGASVFSGDPLSAITSATKRPVPTEISRHPVRLFGGRLAMPGIAAHDGSYVAVAISEAHETHPQQVNGTTWVAIMDAQFNLIRLRPWHTYLPYPRIEPLLNSGGSTKGFMLIGYDEGSDDLSFTTLWETNNWDFTPKQDITTTPLPPGEVSPDPNLFDTHSVGNENVYVSWIRRDGEADYGWNISRIRCTTAGTPTITTVSPGVGQSCHTVWYDAARGKVLAYMRGYPDIYAWNTALGAQTAHPLSVPVPTDTWEGNADVLGNRGNYERQAVTFWGIGTPGIARLPGNQVSITLGGVVSVSARTTLFETMHRRPQPAPTPQDTIQFAFRDETRYAMPVARQNLASMGDADLRVASDDVRESYVVGISSSQRGSFYDGNGAPWMVGQTCMFGGKYLVPYTVPEKNLNPEVTVGFNGNWPDDFAIDKEWPWGLDNGRELVAVAQVDLDSSNRSIVELGGTTLIASGSLNATDGKAVFPAHIDRPHCLIAEPQMSDLFTNGGNVWGRIWVANGVVTSTVNKRQFAFVAVWTDANGNQIRSAPWFADDRTLCDNHPLANSVGPWDPGEWPWRAAGSYLYLPPVWLELFLPPQMAILADQGQLRMECYSTEPYDDVQGGTAPEVWQLCCVSPVLANSNLYYFVLRDDLSQFASEADRPTTTLKNDQADHRPAPLNLYTMTDLPADRPPASNVIAAAGSYVFLLPSEDRRTIWVSKPVEQGRLPEWSSLLSIRAPNGAGNVVSLAGVGDRLFVLAENGAWELFVGSGGPDASGQGGFGSFREIYTKDGAIKHSLTASGLWGCFYVTRSGPKFIGPDGAQVDIGARIWPLLTDAEVEDAANLFRASAFNEQRREIWLYKTDGAFVFNVEMDAWYTSTFSADQAVERLGTITYYDKTIGQVITENPDGTDDRAGGPYIGTVRSPWLSFGSENTYKRLWRIMLLLRTLPDSDAAGFLRVGLEYNYQEGIVDTRDFDWADIVAAGWQHQIAIRPSKQKVSSVRITLQDIAKNVGSEGNPDFVYDVRWALSKIGLEWAAKRGMNKLSNSMKK